PRLRHTATPCSCGPDRLTSVGTTQCPARRKYRLSNHSWEPYICCGSTSTGSLLTHCPSFRIWWKHDALPVWQATPPTCCTRISRASLSQSSAIPATRCRWPEVSPLRQSFCRERDQ